ncbi:MAG: DUF342 domain-containing protein, partial [Deltaproteobacteria bacterium]|nr:DUF342 domain-containing protein [Deltaproteobacteria bacterium]
EITVSEDNMTAFLRFTKGSPSPGTPQKIKELLESKGIRQGIVPDEVIEKYLADSSPKKDALVVARGKSPVPGEDAHITYYFDTDPLKIGAVRHGGTIDYRDRGAIPQVKKGTLLALKEPATAGTPGTDVFGVEIRPPQPKDAKIRCGKGALKTEDGLRAHATQDGEPTLSSDGKLSVFPRLLISGDVGLKSGHVQFDGDVDVTGSVQDGFRVQAGRLTAGEILRSDITVSGDIMVSGGIIGATIRGDGNLKARYIHQARIHLLGDVAVEKEVIDSDIIINGTFLVQTGKIFNSRISAKAGIEAGQIGSDESRPCFLSIGLDEGARAKIEHLKELKKKKRAKRKKLERVIEKLQALSKEMLKKIAEFAQVQDRVMIGQRELKEKVERLKKAGKAEKTPPLLARLEGLDQEIRESDKRVKKRMARQECIESKIEELQKKVEALKSERNTIDEDIEGIYEWSGSSGGRPVVKVDGTIYAHTTIKGPHTGTELMRNFTRSIIREKQVSRSGNQRELWKMVAAPLK